MANRFGFISTYPPTQCGLATFTAALLGALTASGADHGVVARLLEHPQRSAGPEVVVDVVSGDRTAAAGSVEVLNDCDVVIVQHEFGVYGGADGDDVLTLLGQLTVPTIVVLHTVLTEPTMHQRETLESVAAAASAVVTMSHAARERLAAGYRVDLNKVSIIAHGAPDQRPPASGSSGVLRGGVRTVLTWGLLGPGKGIEWGIDAMALLADLRPQARYVVAGHTHPKVAEREGESYREALSQRVVQRSLGGSVVLDGRYRDSVALAELVSSSDVVLLPYDSTDQVTSGVLIEAVAAGKPVVATGFPHAVELLAGGAGLVVPHHDPPAIAAALRAILTRPGVAAAMSRTAALAAPGLRWSAVADQYRDLAVRHDRRGRHGRRVIVRGRATGDTQRSGTRLRPLFDHLAALTDERGLFEHARHAAPRPEHGYCLDDAARALVVTSREPRPSAMVVRLHERYLGFVLAALDTAGRCHNRMGLDGHWQDEPGSRRLVGARGVGTRSCGLALPDLWPTGSRADRFPHRDAVQLTLRPFDGLRRARCGRGDPGPPGGARRAQPVAGRRPRGRRPAGEPRLAVARGSAPLRQRLGRRGTPGGRCCAD